MEPSEQPEGLVSGSENQREAESPVTSLCEAAEERGPLSVLVERQEEPELRGLLQVGEPLEQREGPLELQEVQVGERTCVRHGSGD